MTMDDTKTVRAKILRDFNDAGLERRFDAGDVAELPKGVFDNYRAAGLVEADAEPITSAAESGASDDAGTTPDPAAPTSTAGKRRG
jgi:hypothetical protein